MLPTESQSQIRYEIHRAYVYYLEADNHQEWFESLCRPTMSISPIRRLFVPGASMRTPSRELMKMFPLRLTLFIVRP